MIRKTALAALAVALPLTLGAVAPAAADTRDYYYGDRDRYSRDYNDRDYNDRSYDRGYGDRYYGDRYAYNYRILSPRQIVYRLSRYGYSRIRNVYLSSAQRVYHAEARDWRGYHVRLRVSARSGRVLSSRVTYRPYRGRGYRGYYGY
jgi:hypothetical protein